MANRELDFIEGEITQVREEMEYIHHSLNDLALHVEEGNRALWSIQYWISLPIKAAFWMGLVYVGTEIFYGGW